MKTPVTITAVWMEVRKTSESPSGQAILRVEIDGEWVDLLTESFDPDGCHLSHIVEGAGIEGKASGREMGITLKPLKYERVLGGFKRLVGAT